MLGIYEIIDQTTQLPLLGYDAANYAASNPSDGTPADRKWDSPSSVGSTVGIADADADIGAGSSISLRCI